MTSVWAARSPEERRLLNPALTALILAAGAAGHERESSAPLPIYFSYLIVPAVLDSQLREALPRTIRTTLPSWLADHPLFQGRVAARVAPFERVVREGLFVGLSSGLLEMKDQGLVDRRPASRASLGPEVADISRAAEFLGRWFARVGSPSTVFAFWGTKL
jgi:hypothetical protein